MPRVFGHYVPAPVVALAAGKIDLKDITNDPKTNEDIALRPGDVLIVPERIF